MSCFTHMKGNVCSNWFKLPPEREESLDWIKIIESFLELLK
jgi:hypothetical protein